MYNAMEMDWWNQCGSDKKSHIKTTGSRTEIDFELFAHEEQGERNKANSSKWIEMWAKENDCYWDWSAAQSFCVITRRSCLVFNAPFSKYCCFFVLLLQKPATSPWLLNKICSRNKVLKPLESVFNPEKKPIHRPDVVEFESVFLVVLWNATGTGSFATVS